MQMGDYMSEIRYYILFNNYTDGLKLESKLKDNKIKYVISPTPRQLSSCCGISIMYNKEDEMKIRKIIDKDNLSTKGFYSLEKEVKKFY